MVKLFCIVDGEKTPFTAIVSEDATVDDLKKAIYSNITVASNIKPKDLQLWSVSIPFGNEDQPIELKNQDDATKLPSTSILSDVFNKLSKRAIQVIVEVPISETTDLQKQLDLKLEEIAYLQKQLSDLQARQVDQTNNDLRATEISTLEELRQVLRQHFEKIDEDEYEYIQIYVHDGVTPVLLRSNEQLRAILEKALDKKSRTLSISLDSPSKQFSSWTWNDVVVEYKVAAYPGALPDFKIEVSDLTIEEANMLDQVVKQCLLRNNVYMFDPSANEATRSTIIDTIMVGAMEFFKSEMFLAQQHKICGKRGHGPVDFAILERPHGSQILVITEVKKENYVQGLAQNMVQLDVAVQQKKRKRVEEDEEVPACLKSYGIVTDAFKWTLIECTLDTQTERGEDIAQYRTLDVPTYLQLNNEMDTRKSCETIFKYILALCRLMRGELVNRGSYNNASSVAPSSKRVKSGL
ncbi:hypothetical protein BX616_001813 [Lobosporangium transversale]|nr:hypothetical protein BX616_001813 [Lobosporangium transversale]